MNRSSLLVVFTLLAAVALTIELGRHTVIPATADTRNLILGVELLVWIVAGCALLRRINIRA